MRSLSVVAFVAASGCYVRGVEVVGATLAAVDAVTVISSTQVPARTSAPPVTAIVSGCELAMDAEQLGPAEIRMRPDGRCEAVVWTRDGRFEGPLHDGFAHGRWRLVDHDGRERFVDYDRGRSVSPPLAPSLRTK